MGTRAEPSREEAAPLKEEFEDKEVVHMKTLRAQPPWRTMSEKTCSGAAGHTSTMRAVSPELWRAKSENGRRRQRRSTGAATVVPVKLGMDDEEAFRQAVEVFIAKQQTWFHYEESLIIAHSPWEIKWPRPYPLIGEFPAGNQGSGPLPSLVCTPSPHLRLV
jgi:hypothetical protein